MTIELGFSHCRLSMAFDSRLIDVPGHERFIHTMLAGASGVDLALLVVAADDSVMPQTREHLAVLELLGVRRGLIALTKCDLVDEEQLEMVRLEVAELVEPTFLAGRPVIATSTRTGLGIAELKQAFVTLAKQLPTRATEDPRFRLPIDRVFSPSGQGTIVTGTVWRGTARAGDTLHLLPEATSRPRSPDAVAGSRCRMRFRRASVRQSTWQESRRRPSAGETSWPRRRPSSRHAAIMVHLRCLPDAGHGLKHRDRDAHPSRGRPGDGAGAHAATRNPSWRRSIRGRAVRHADRRRLRRSRSSCGNFRRLGPSAAERSSGRRCVPPNG